MNRKNSPATNTRVVKRSPSRKSDSRTHLWRKPLAFYVVFGLFLLGLPLSAGASTTINHQFEEATINQGDPSLYTITISNDSTFFALTDANVTVFLDNTSGAPDVTGGHITIVSGTVIGNTCGFTGITAQAGTSKIVLTGGTIPIASGSPSKCIFSINVTSTTPGVWHAFIPINTTPDLYTSGYEAKQDGDPVHNTTDADVSLLVTALSAPTGTKSYSPSPAIAGDPTTLTVTLTNLNAGSTMPLTSFTDALPNDGSGHAMVVANPAGASVSCTGAGAVNGTFSPSPGATLLTLTGGTIGQGGACTLRVNVVVSSVTGLSQVFNNTLGDGAIGNTRGLTSPAFNTNLTVNTSIAVGKSFNPTTIPSGQPALMTLTITNNSTVNGLNITTFADDLTGTTLKVLTTASSPVAAPANPIVVCDGAGAVNGSLSFTPNTVDTTLTLNGAAAGPRSGINGKCVITAYVTSTTDGAHTNTIPANAVINPNGIPSPTAGDTLNVNAQLTVDKTVSVDQVAPGQWTLFTVTINNWSGAAVSNVSFLDLLPKFVLEGVDHQMVLDNSGGAIYTASSGCTLDGSIPIGTWTGTDSNGVSTGIPPAAGNAGIRLTGGGIVAGSGVAAGICTITIRAKLPGTATTVMDFSNQIPASGVNGTGNGPGGPGTAVVNPTPSPAANVTTIDAVAVSKGFNPSLIPQGGTSTLTLTIRNRVVAGSLTGVNLIDHLPAGISLAANPAASNTCNGTLQAFPGDSQLILTNGTVAARPGGSLEATCTITARVTGTALGTYTNTIQPGDFLSSGGTIPGNVAANLTITTGLSGAKSFNPTAVTSGGVSRVTITVTNATNGDLTNVSMDDNDFVTGTTGTLQIANPANAGTSCPGSPTLVANPGAGQARLLGASLVSGASCDFSFDVVTTGTGPWQNTIGIGQISSAEGPANTAAVSAGLNAVGAQININKSFNPVVITGGVPSTLTLTLTNPSGTTLHGIGFTDVFPPGIQVYSVPNVTSTCAGGTVTAIPGDGQVSLSGAFMAAGSTCVITLQTTSIKFLNLTNNIPAGAVFSAEGYTNPSRVSATLSTLQGLGVMKAFSPAYVPPTTIIQNSIAKLQMWLVSTYDTNDPSPMTLTGVSYTDTLPSGLVVAAIPNASTTCPATTGGGMATVTAIPGTSLVTLSGAKIAPGTVCAISADVLAPDTPGTYTNTIPANVILTDQGPTNNNPATANLYVVSQPTVSKAFSPAIVAAGGTSLLTVTINNGAGIPITGVALTDSLPTGLAIAGNPAAATSCSNGTVTAQPGTAALSLSGATIPASGFCTFSARVVANAPGVYLNSINAGQLTCIEGLSNPGAANDTLTARSTPVVSKSFTPVSILAGDTSTLTIAIGNGNANPITLSADLVDALPGNVFVAGTPNASTTCTGGTLTANAGANFISYSGGTIPGTIPGPAGCTISVDVTSGTAGVHTNIIAAGQLLTSAGSNQDPAFADLAVGLGALVPPTVSKSFTLGTIAAGGTSTLTIVLNNPNSSALTLSAPFTDTLPANVVVASNPTIGGTCAGSVTAAGGTITYALGATIPVGGCTITVPVTSIIEGSYTNTIPADALRTNGGNNHLPATAGLVVRALVPPTVVKSFTPNTINPGGVSRLTLFLGNANIGAISLNTDFTDTLPNKVTVAATPNIGGTCINTNPGKVAAAGSSSSITYQSGATIPAGGCTILVDVTSSDPGGPYTNTISPNTLDTTADKNGASTSANLFVNPPQPPSVSKSFSAAKFLSAGTVTLTISLGNGNASDATLEANLVDTLPAGLIIATPSGLATNCPGTVQAPEGGNTVTYLQSGGSIPGNGGCAISVTVKAADALPHHLFTNTIPAGALQTNFGNNAVDSSATVQVLVRPTITKTFNPSTIKFNQSSTLTLTLGNPNDVPITLSQDLVDSLPTNVAVAGTPAIGGTCLNTNPEKVTAVALSGSITYQSGASIPAGSCTITVSVTSVTMGDYTNTINADGLKTDAGTNLAPTSAPLRVLAPPTLTKDFTPKQIIAGAPSTLTLNLGHPNPQALTLQSALTDTLPGAVRVAATPAIGGTCLNTNPGKVTAVAGSNTITYQSGATIPIGGCTITVNVTAATAGSYLNTIPAGGLNTEAGSNALAATDTLTVFQGLTTIAKTITATSLAGSTPNSNINRGETLSYSIEATLSEGQYTNFSLTDNKTTIPNPITCGSNGFTCSGNVGVAGANITVTGNGTPGHDFGTITYVYTSGPLTSSSTNTATMGTDWETSQTASTTWTLGNPAWSLAKSMSPSTIKGGDPVTVTLTWRNTNANNPMFNGVIIDTLPIGVFGTNPTVTPGTTPAGYTFSSSDNTVTYTRSDNTAMETSVVTATFGVTVRSDVVTGSTYTNTADGTAKTLPADDPNLASAGTINATQATDTLTATPPGTPTKVVSSTSQTFTDPGDANKNANPPVAIGERVTYSLTFSLPPGQTNTVTLVDEVTTGMGDVSLVSTALSRSATTLTAANDGALNWSGGTGPVDVTGLITASGNEFQLPLGNVYNSDTANATYSLTMELRVANVVHNIAGNPITNRSRFRYRNINSPGTDQNLNSGNVSVHVTVPIVAIDKTVSPGAPTGGDTVTYTLKIANTSGPNTATGYNWTFADTVPADLSSPGNIQDTSNPNGRTISGSFSDHTLNGTIDQLDPGEEIVITYTATVPTTMPFGKTITNGATAQATTIKQLTPTPDPDEAYERTGAGGTDNLYGSKSVPVTLDTPTISKSVEEFKTYYPIGDVAKYRVTMPVRVGTAVNFTLTDVLPVGLTYNNGSLSVSLPGGASISNGALVDANGSFFLLSGNTITLTFGNLTVPTAGEITVDFNATVQNVIANQDGTTFTNSATLTFDNPGGGTITIGPTTNSQIRVGEPNLTMAKAITAGAAGSDAGNTVSWSVSIQNTGHTTAFQVNWRDVLPGGLNQISNVAISTSGGNVYRNGTTTAPVAGDALISMTTNPNDTVALPLLQMDPGATLTITFNTVVMDTVTPGQMLNNTTRASYTSLVTGGRDNATNPGAVDDENNDDLNNYEESAGQALTIASAIAVQKTVTPVSATIGQDVPYTVRIDLIEGLTPSLFFSDTLPAGLTYQSHSISIGNPGLLIGNPTHDINLGSGQTVQFDFGNVSNPTNGINSDDYILIDIVARVDNNLSNQNAVILRNGEQAAGSSVYVQYGLGPTRVDFDNAPAPGIQGVPLTLIEPNLSVTKTANLATQSLGDVVTFTVQVQHTGASTADAYDLVLDDVLPAGIAYVTDSATLPAPDVTVAGQNIQFRYSSFPLAGPSKSFSYQARIDLTAPVGQTLSNTMALTWKSQTGSDGTAHSGRTGSDGPGGLNDYRTTASANVSVNENAAISAVKTVTDLNGGTLLPNEVLEYTIVLRNNAGAVTNVVFTDTVPANTTYLGNLTTTKGTADFIGGTVTVTVGSMAPAETVTVTFRVTVNSGVAAGTVISNQGRVDSDQTVPTPTDADGIPGNGYQPTTIVVSGPPDLHNALYVEKIVSWITDADSSGSITPGDRMRYTLIFHNLGQQTLTNVGLTDTIPANLAYVSSSASASSGTISVNAPAVTVSGLTLPVSGTATAQFDVTVGAVGTFSNQGTATSDQTGSVKTDGNGDPTDGNQPTVFTAVASGGGTPVIDVQKRWHLAVDLTGDGRVNPDDTIGYTITLRNTGSAAATNVRLADSIPAKTTVVAGSAHTSQGVIIGEDPLSVNIGTVNPGALVTVSFVATVSHSTPSCTIIANQASVTGGNFSAVVSDDNANPGDGLNPTLTPVACSSVGLSKVLWDTSETGSAGSNLMIGEVATYRITIDVPAGTTREMTMTDTLPVGMSYRPATARLMRSFDTGLAASANPGNINGALSGTFVALADGTDVTVSGQTITLFLGDVINSDDDINAESYTLELKALVLNTTGNQAGITLTNQAGLSYLNGLLQPQNLTPVSHTSTVMEPQIQITKAAAPLAILPSGGTVTYTVAITNPAGASVGTAYEARVTDSLPAVFGNLSAIFTTPSGGVSGVVNNSAGTTLDVRAAVFPPDGQLIITYQGTAAGPLTDGSTINNTAVVAWTSLPGDRGTLNAAPGAPGSATGERNRAIPPDGLNDYASTASALVRVGPVGLAKEVLNSQARYAIGDIVTYRVTIGLARALTVGNVLLQDVLAEGLTYQSGTLVVAKDPGISTSLSPAEFTRTDNSPALGQEKLELNFATVTVSGAGSGNLTLTYQARVDNSITTQNNQNLLNQATLGFTDPGTGLPASLNAGTSVTVGEPHLTLAKTITSAMAGLDAGDTVSFQVIAGNDGTTTAFETVLTDLLPTGLENITNVNVSPAGGAGLPTVTNLGGQWQTTAFILPVGGTVTITFDARISITALPGEQIQNSVRAAFTSRNGADPNERDGSTPGSNQDDGQLNNYNFAANAPIITVSDPVAIDKQFYPLSTKTTFAIGEPVTYRLKISLIEGTVNNLVVTDTLPAGVTFTGSLVGVGSTNLTYTGLPTPVQAGQVLTFALGQVTNLPDGIGANDFITIDVSVRVDNLAENQDRTILGNQARVQFTDSFGTLLTREFDADANTPGIQPLYLSIVEPNLRLLKSANPTTVSLGDETTFTIVVGHAAASRTTAYDIVVTDTLPAGLTYVDGSGTPTPAVNGQTLTFTIDALTLAADQSAITLRAKLDLAAAAGIPLTNQAIATYTSLPGVSPDERTGSGGFNDYIAVSTAEITPSTASSIEAVKTVTDLNGGLVMPGDTLEYNVTLTNTGGSGLTQVRFTDPLPARTAFAGSLTTTKGSGSLTGSLITVNVGNLAPAETVTILFQVTVNGDTPSGTVISNQGMVDSAQTVPKPTDSDGNPGNGYQPTDVVVGGVSPQEARLYAEKTAALFTDADGNGSFSVGDTVRYTVLLRNMGKVPLTNMTFSDPIPANLSYVSESATVTSGGVVGVSGANLSATVPTLAAGGLTEIRFDVTIENPGTFTNQGTMASDQTESALTDSDGAPENGNQPTRFNAVAANGVGSPSLVIDKLGILAEDFNGDGLVNPGESITYVITIQNIGSSAAEDVRLSDPLPALTTISTGSVTSTHGAVLSENPVTVNIGQINPGEVVTVRFRTRVDAGAPNGTSVLNTATVSQAGSGPLQAQQTTFILSAPAIVGSLCGSVFKDCDQDAVRDPLERGLSGVTVHLFRGNGTWIATATTNFLGVYRFEGVPEGPYKVQDVVPPGYLSSTPKEVSVSIIEGETSTASFGLQTQNGPCQRKIYLPLIVN
jgi:uncharacterized repeat protein (TIGR01451 family)/fimbrial isopeptide formation D2 family protein